MKGNNRKAILSKAQYQKKTMTTDKL